jgi:hypothetical protein
MDKALDLVGKALKRHRPTGPDVGTRPDLTLPLLPPRTTPVSGNGNTRKRAKR